MAGLARGACAGRGASRDSSAATARADTRAAIKISLVSPELLQNSRTLLSAPSPASALRSVAVAVCRYADSGRSLRSAPLQRRVIQCLPCFTPTPRRGQTANRPVRGD